MNHSSHLVVHKPPESIWRKKQDKEGRIWWCYECNTWV